MDVPDPARRVIRETENGRVRLDDLAWSPDGLLLAGVGADADVVRFWDAEGRYAPHRFRGLIDSPARNTAVAWTAAEAQRIAVGGDAPGTNRIVSLENGDEIHLPWSAAVTRAAWSPDGKRLALGRSDGGVDLCLLDHGPQAVAKLDPLGGPICGLAWTGNALLTVAAEETLAICAWNAPYGPTALETIPVGTAPTCMAVQPGGDCLTVGGVGGDLLMWDPSVPNYRHHLVCAHPGPVRTLAWHPSGRLLASACDDRLLFWKPGAPEPHHVMRLAARGHRLAWHPGGGLLALATHDGYELFLIDFRDRDPPEVDPRYADGSPPRGL